MKHFKLLFLFLTMSIALYSQSPLIIAHRGASHLAPENTLAAVNLAWKNGARAVEIDVHLSSDQKIMVMHDKTTKRTTGVDYVIAETHSSLIRGLDAGSWKGPEFKAEPVPFLEEVIATVPEGGLLFVEVKCGPEILPVLEKTFKESGKMDQMVVISFNWDVVAGSKRVMPAVPASFLKYTLKGNYSRKWISEATAAGLDGLNFSHHGLRKGYVEKVHRAGLKMYTWTVDDPQKARILVEAGVDGITTNRPAWLKEQLGAEE